MSSRPSRRRTCRRPWGGSARARSPTSSSSSSASRPRGRLISTEQFRDVILRTNPDGSVLRLGDVARIELGAANLDRETRLNGSPATVVAIYQSPGANAPHDPEGGRGPSRRPGQVLPRGTRLEGHLRSHDLHHRDGTRGPQDPARSLRPRRRGGVPVPRQPTRDALPTLAVPVSLIGNLHRPEGWWATRRTPSRFSPWCWPSASSSTTPSWSSRTSSA